MTDQPVKFDVAQRLGQAMCAAWGLDPNYVTRIVVVWEPHDLPHAEVDLLMSETAVRELLTLSVVDRADGREH